MIMTIATINSVIGVLSGMKINKIVDKKVKTSLLNNYICLRRFAKEASEDRVNLVEKFKTDFADEIQVVAMLRHEEKPLDDHKEYLDAERDLDAAAEALLKKEVDAPVAPIAMDAFMSACDKEELTLEQIAILEDAGLLE